MRESILKRFTKIHIQTGKGLGYDPAVMPLSECGGLPVSMVYWAGICRIAVRFTVMRRADRANHKFHLCSGGMR